MTSTLLSRGLLAHHTDYFSAYAPNAQKARNLLNACGIPYQCCEQPFFQPRPILTDLGVEYRRVPVNFIGKDGYCDNRVFLSAVQDIFNHRRLEESPADHAYEAFGYRSFWVSLPLVPEKLRTEQLGKDRMDLFTVFARDDYPSLRPGALAEFKQLLSIVENDFLANSRFINGRKVSVADIHASWMIKWALETIETGKEPGFGPEDFPKVYKWIGGLKDHDEKNAPPTIEAEEAKKQLLGADYAAREIGIDSKDPMGLKKGQKVSVETSDE